MACLVCHKNNAKVLGCVLVFEHAQYLTFIETRGGAAQFFSYYCLEHTQEKGVPDSHGYLEGLFVACYWIALQQLC